MRETGHPVDVAVGQNIRLIRKARGLTQENLAAGLGVTFQQLQKYEKAANRVSCSMLIRICEQLGGASDGYIAAGEWRSASAEGYALVSRRADRASGSAARNCIRFCWRRGRLPDVGFEK